MIKTLLSVIAAKLLDVEDKKKPFFILKKYEKMFSNIAQIYIMAQNKKSFFTSIYYFTGDFR
jgi:hypothetical protein